MQIENLRTRLENVNQELSAILDREPVSLSYQSGEAGVDSLFLYGIVGGKDVGKTSLINQLAGARISIDTDILDEGTNKAVAYCHRDDMNALKQRLGASEADHILYAPHSRQELKNVILIDFPDFDSRFVHHRDDVVRLSKFLQGIVWVTTPRKYGDHEFLEQLMTVAQSHEYYFIVLNKIDQIASKVSLDEARKDILSYLAAECAKKSVAPPSESQFYMLSALNPQKYEFDKFHTRLVRVHSPEEIARAKIKNLQTEFEKNIARINDGYKTGDTLQSLEQTLAFTEELVTETFSSDYFSAVQQRITSLESMQQRIRMRVFRKKTESLPVLWMIYFPLAGLIHSLGGLLIPAQTGNDSPESPKDLLRFHGTSASMRIMTLLDRIKDENPLLSTHVRSADIQTDKIYQRFSEWLAQYEEEITNRLIAELKPPSKAQKALVYLPLLWFPFLQPFLIQLAHSEDGVFSFSTFVGIFEVFVSIFGAGSLLVSMVFLVVLYAVWLMLLYANCAKRTAMEGEDECKHLWYGQLLKWVLDELSASTIKLRDTISNKCIEMEHIHRIIMDEVQKTEAGKP